MKRDLREAAFWVAGAGALLSLGMLFFFGLRAGISTAVGAALACANLYILSRVVAAMLGRGSSVKAWRAVGVVKMISLIAAVWLLLTTGLVDPIPLVVGLGALPLGLATGSMLSTGRGKEAPEEDD